MVCSQGMLDVHQEKLPADHFYIAKTKPSPGENALNRKYCYAFRSLASNFQGWNPKEQNDRKSEKQPICDNYWQEVSGLTVKVKEH